jgi:HSP20 family protein
MNNTMTKTDKRQPEQRSQEVQRAQPEAQRGYISPRVNITETKDGYLLEAEMPGVNKAGLEILLENNELTLVGHRHLEHPNAQLLYRESVDRDFRRVFTLDPTIDSPKIDARMENGVLKLHLPKAEELKPRKIKVSD